MGKGTKVLPSYFLSVMHCFVYHSLFVKFGPADYRLFMNTFKSSGPSTAPGRAAGGGFALLLTFLPCENVPFIVGGVCV